MCNWWSEDMFEEYCTCSRTREIINEGLTPNEFDYFILSKCEL